MGCGNNKYLHRAGTKAKTGDLNMVNNKIINLGDPTSATDGVNKQYLEKSHVIPSHYKYITNKLE